MVSKGFLVKVEIDIHKVTCPGVWLCSNGKVSLHLRLLGSSIQTKMCRPTFPILFYEKYIFSKTFHEDQRLNELQKSLNNEWFHAELIHWKSSEEGCILASFDTTLDDMLYPSSFRGTVSGKETDLLMVPTGIFPGTIAPKLEVSTRTSVEQIVCQPLESNLQLTNKKTIESTLRGCKHNFPRRVCHSVAYSRAQKPVSVKELDNKPPFVCRKVPDDLILRKNNNYIFRDESPKRYKSIDRCYCTSRSSMRLPSNKFNEHSQSDVPTYEHPDMCSVCSTYEGYFLPKARYSVRDDELTKICSFCRQCYATDKFPKVCRCAVQEYQPLMEHYDSCSCFERKRSNLTQKLHNRLSQILENPCIDCKDSW